MDSFIIAALVLCSLTVPAFGDKGTSKARSCSDIRQFYSGKGFSLDGVPQSEMSGEHLRICPQGYTCCTSEMEDNLAILSRREIEGVLKNDGRSLQTSIVGHHKVFDEYFHELLNRSMISLQETFTSTWGALYSENAKVFSDLYKDLRGYYQGSKLNLEELFSEFWAKLLEKVLYQENKKNSIDEEYLECVSKEMETLEPFGNTPEILTIEVTRKFVAARSFVLGLLLSKDVVQKVSQVPLSQECMRAITKMTYCPYCRGMPSARPCSNYCSNVMKGCLANQADLNTEWRHLAETMSILAERRLKDVDKVILSIPNHISGAMLTMVENLDTINSKLLQSCGSLREGGTSSTGVEEIKGGRVTVEDKLEDSSVKMAKLVEDVAMRLRDMQSHWVSLPKILCDDRVATGAGAEDKCWNGISRARYLPEVMGDGIASQINNPEVEVDITKPDKTIRQQILQLKVMINRLKNALNGRDVDFQDTNDDASGSGSGNCPDEMCSRGPRLVVPVTDRPIFYLYPPEKNRVKSSAQQSLPSIAICLLSLLTLLLRR
ncbi:glypican-1-like [Melanotaenia boesemani]|uniref:glypican-1-like n=1 Tax=Melanotaenia boesemani TaxID=1250792 RepID=UPI001C04AE3A|nr:glypican-1-like [Melanotaenia boesemani]XP_041848832.1 glypican-1-like [Melanotaenia boesemani]